MNMNMDMDVSVTRQQRACGSAGLPASKPKQSMHSEGGGGGVRSGHAAVVV
jgi:hypothetical protein